MYNKREVLIVDDEPNSARAFSEVLTEEGYDVYESANVETAIDMIQRNDIAAIITDSKMRCGDGTQLFEYVRENHPDIPVILLTASKTDEHAFLAMSRKAFCYFKKPPDYLCLKGMIDRAVEQHSLKKEVQILKNRLVYDHMRYRIIGNTAGMLRIFNIIEAVKDSDRNVLVCGEAGSGKELIARTINNCREKGGPFIVFNCAAMPKELIDSELFGWDKGVFSGTHTRRTGKFEEASSGTLFLDEIGELELSLQAKLFRVIQEKELEPPGSSRNKKVDFRLISSTKRDLKKEVKDGNFREDLFYRINQIEIAVPPLRERKDDILLLFSAFMNEFCIKDRKALTISDKVMKALENYSWPGNVRELRNVVERAVILATGDKITLKEIPEELLSFKRATANINNPLKTFRELEMEALKDALQACKGNKSKASRLLGISRKAMYKRLRDSQQKEYAI
jgi:DNA-binding NtrC family response regulator